MRIGRTQSFFRKIKSWLHACSIPFTGQDKVIYQILKEIQLFDPLTDVQLSSLVKGVKIAYFKSGEVIFHQGDVGDRLFLIKSGSVRIYLVKEGTEVILARLEKGDFFGEQALLEEIPGNRMSSAKAATDCELYAISHAAYLQVINPEMKRLIKEIGKKELYELFSETAHQVLLINEDISREISGEIFEFNDGEKIFSIHDDADMAYFVLTGTVVIELPSEDGRVRKTELGTGSLFGELGMLGEKKRAATAIAKGKVKLVGCDTDKFKKLYENSPELRFYVSSLKNVYQTRHGGTIKVFKGKFLKADSIYVIYNIDGNIITSIKLLGSLGFMMSHSDITGAKTVHFGRGADIRRKLSLKDRKVLGVLSFGDWLELNEVCNLILNGTPVTEEQVQSFITTGQLGIRKSFELSLDQRKEILCTCMNITKGQICDAITSGNKLALIMEKTGAGSVCGTCRPKIVELFGLKAWTTVKFTKKISLHPNISSFQFTPLEPVQLVYEPGQFVIISALIDGNFINRSYTLTSVSSDPFIEITVKKEPKGYFSSWLFEKATENSLFRISDPQGNFTPIKGDSPKVYFAAGIGITPALAAARYFFNADSIRQHIDYSAGSKDDFILKNEWAKLTSNSKTTLNYRATREEGRLQSQEIAKIIQKFPDAEFYICGPKPYEDFLLATLKAEGVIDAKIRTERFFHAGLGGSEMINM